jgi:cysteine-rich repeat protein
MCDPESRTPFRLPAMWLGLVASLCAVGMVDLAGCSGGLRTKRTSAGGSTGSGGASGLGGLPGAPDASPGKGGAAGSSLAGDSGAGGLGTGGALGSGGTAAPLAGASGTGGWPSGGTGGTRVDPFGCYLPSGGCAPHCYDLDPCFSEGCPANCVPRSTVIACGNAKREPGEECDDGNTLSEDGCSPACVTEPGWDCTSGVCVRVWPVDGGQGLDGAALRCGDGILSGAEECDDGILDGSYGGCAQGCKLAAYCGDGIINGPEECDLGKENSPGSACTPQCKIQFVWTL